jgi:ABC-type xylose transport system permease subunit
MMRDMRRMRITAIVTALVIVIPILALSTIAGIRILLLLPIVMSFWFLFYMPRWRRRVRQQARNLRRWNLHPE